MMISMMVSAAWSENTNPFTLPGNPWYECLKRTLPTCSTAGFLHESIGVEHYCRIVLRGDSQSFLPSQHLTFWKTNGYIVKLVLKPKGEKPTTRMPQPCNTVVALRCFGVQQLFKVILSGHMFA